MEDVTGFVDAIGRDVEATVVPKVDDLARQIGEKALTVYGPRIAAFASELTKEIIDEQSAAIRSFVTAAIQDLFQRYRPTLNGELHTRIVRDGLEVTGQEIRLDLTRRDTGALVSSLDLPVSLTIRIPELGVSLEQGTIRLDVVT
jgi:hypothetical protein